MIASDKQTETEPDTDVSEMEDVLRDSFHRAGRRLTRQRQLILKVLQASDGHLDAERLHDQVKVRDPNISLATVYRTLGVLQEMGLVEQHSLGEDHGHYEAVRDGPHYHFNCLGCGEVIEFDAPEVALVARRLSQERGLEIVEAHLTLSGYCARCQRQRASTMSSDQKSD